MKLKHASVNALDAALHLFAGKVNDGDASSEVGDASLEVEGTEGVFDQLRRKVRKGFRKVRRGIFAFLMHSSRS